jgi:hypothetical protein
MWEGSQPVRTEAFEHGSWINPLCCICYLPTNGEDTEDSEHLLHAVVNCKVYELMVVV